MSWKFSLVSSLHSLFVGDHPDLPAGGHEEDTVAITERNRVRESTRRHAVPAEYEFLLNQWT
jgi:hypothetical protein